MTNQEFIDEFDVLYNNITSNQAPGLDNYEKSVFLTKAQHEILLSYFNPKSNKVLDGYDGSEIRQMDFSSVTKSYKYNFFYDAMLDNKENSKNVNLPSDVLIIINEFVFVDRNNRGKDIRLSVFPIDYTTYITASSKPFQRPLKNQAWRLLINTGSNSADLVVGANDTIKSYQIRYVRRPRPIVLEDLDGVSIEGVSTVSTCELDPIIHREILQRAVELAKASYLGGVEYQVSIGNNSATDKGFLGEQKQQ